MCMQLAELWYQCLSCLVISSGRCKKQHVVDDSGIIADNEYEMKVCLLHSTYLPFIS